MNSSLPFCLIVSRGAPYEDGTALVLDRTVTRLGRRASSEGPDIAFDNAYVSRRQASIRFLDGSYYLTDLASKHGTNLNGVPLQPFVPALLASGDRISLARGMIELAFGPRPLEETLDFTLRHERLSAKLTGVKPEYELDPVRYTLRLGPRSFAFSEKEFRLLELLVRKEKQFVSKEEIVRYVWPERPEGMDPARAASAEEINSLLYRIRKKTDYALSIENIRGKGYVFQEPVFSDC
ncbi:FHA domain-containing protein [Cohnella zeiphila]|uniref:Winged helix-turn-helix domain-containing protein n=1 Tax=Cohnella zeiphila TaxID=2761120 RepID=A0A7X0VTX3_9BACL|nr:FHA domain-containing protein [Cohnella zeiphila]MBB6730389.1 winged helix-turn-helix domain-containing protein [Cohnella zeiphila]